jgi:hypothetical protein
LRIKDESSDGRRKHQQKRAHGDGVSPGCRLVGRQSQSGRGNHRHNRALPEEMQQRAGETLKDFG